MERQTKVFSKKQYDMIVKAEHLYKQLEPFIKHWIKTDINGLVYANLFIDKDKGIVVARLDKDNIHIKELSSIIGKATCNPKDVFNERVGIDIAVSRLALNITKYIHRQADKKFDELEEKLCGIVLEINKDYMKLNKKLSKF